MTREHPKSDEQWLQLGYRYALALTHHTQDAEDLCQQAWLQLFKRYGKIESRRLLFVTLRRLFVDRFRRDQRVEFLALEHVPEPFTEPQLPELSARELDTLLGGLRAAEREALYLNAVEGYTAAEIGELTDQPRNSVLSLIHRAKRKLVQQLESTPAPVRQGGPR